MRLALILIAAGVAFGQDAKLQFEVASLKLSPPGRQGPLGFEGGPGTDDPGQFRAKGIGLTAILTRSLDGKAYRLAALPGMADVKVDIVAKLPPGTTREELNVMLLNLMVERFAIKLHKETREMPGYQLRIAKGGLKMQEAAAATGPDLAYANESIRTVQSPDGKPPLAPGRKGKIRMGIGNGRQRITARLQEMADIVQTCESMMGKPVINETGLKGVYDFYVDFAPLGRGGSAGDSASSTPLGGTDDPAAPFEIAIESALGLKLQPKKLQIDVTVIDQMSKTPIEN